MLVKDYSGKLIPRENARGITGDDGVKRFYEQGVSCIKMPDGKWYRTTTGKIIYDHSIKKWVFGKDFHGVTGLVEDGSIGSYSDRSQEITVLHRQADTIKKVQFDLNTKQLNTSKGQVPSSHWSKCLCISQQVAEKLGYEESIYDGLFYKISDCTAEEKAQMLVPNIPPNEKSNTYSLDDDKDHRIYLEKKYDDAQFTIERRFSLIARRYIPYTFGFEIETQNGFLPARIREKYGFRSCRDGSLDGGLEFVSIPVEGGKGLQACQNICKELSKRTKISNKCSVHIHFGDVRRDRLYIVSLWKTLYKLQNEFRLYFPYSRTHSIREDGKIYAALLPNLQLKTSHILKISDDEEFKKAVTEQWSTIYTFLNAGHPAGETIDEEFIKATREVLIKGKIQKQYCFRVAKSNYTTKLPRHAIQGHKWQRPQRYFWCNFLNLFFAHSKTIEMRISEATINFDKILYLLLTYVAILKYAENYAKTLSEDPITLKDIIEDHFPKKISEQILNYWYHRKSLFVNATGFKAGWKEIEQKYMSEDAKFSNKLNVE